MRIAELNDCVICRDFRAGSARAGGRDRGAVRARRATPTQRHLHRAGAAGDRVRRAVRARPPRHRRRVLGPAARRVQRRRGPRPLHLLRARSSASAACSPCSGIEHRSPRRPPDGPRRSGRTTPRLRPDPWSPASGLVEAERLGERGRPVLGSRARWGGSGRRATLRAHGGPVCAHTSATTSPRAGRELATRSSFSDAGARRSRPCGTVAMTAPAGSRSRTRRRSTAEPGAGDAATTRRWHPRAHVTSSGGAAQLVEARGAGRPTTSRRRAPDAGNVQHAPAAPSTGPRGERRSWPT